MTSVSRWAVLTAAALLLTVPAGAAEKRFGLTSFEAIEVNADVVVEVSARAPVGAVASGPADALDRLSLETRDGRLVISTRKFAGDDSRRSPQGPVTIRVNAAGLRSAQLAGAGSLRIDELKGTRVLIGLRGPGRLTVGKVTTDRLSIAMIGNGSLTLGGTAKQGQLILSGAGIVDAGKLAVDELTSDSEGAGDLTLFAVRSAAVTTRGIGKTVVLGRPVCTVHNLGSGSVSCGQQK